MLDYLIIGAGISGISLGRILQSAGNNNFVILEAEDEAGGLCRTKIVDNHIFDIGGGHSLCTPYQQVYDFVFAHIAKSEFNFFERVSKIHLDGHILDYPIEANLWQLPLEKQVEYLISAIRSGETAGLSAPKNYEEWIHWKLGDEIAASYMLPYNNKLWGVPSAVMDIDWLYKIPRLNVQEILKRCLNKSSGHDTIPNHPVFYYPKTGGFQTLFESIYQHVAPSVILKQPVVKLTYRNNFWSINDTYEARCVINTAPWPSLYDALGSPNHLEKDFAKLIHNSLVFSLWEEEYQHNWHWSYYPDSSIEYHRRFYICNFAPHSRPGGIFSETNLKRWPNKGSKWASNKKPIYEHINEFAYPIPVCGYLQAITNILDYYADKKLFGLGRWGQWQYLDADVCIKEAMKLSRKLGVN